MPKENSRPENSTQMGEVVHYMKIASTSHCRYKGVVHERLSCAGMGEVLDHLINVRIEQQVYKYNTNLTMTL